MVDSRTSPNSLYDEGIATMEGGGLQPDRRRRFLRSRAQPGASTGPASQLLIRGCTGNDECRRLNDEARSTKIVELAALSGFGLRHSFVI